MRVALRLGLRLRLQGPHFWPMQPEQVDDFLVAPKSNNFVGLKLFGAWKCSVQMSIWRRVRHKLQQSNSNQLGGPCDVLIHSAAAAFLQDELLTRRVRDQREATPNCCRDHHTSADVSRFICDQTIGHSRLIVSCVLFPCGPMHHAGL